MDRKRGRTKNDGVKEKGGGGRTNRKGERIKKQGKKNGKMERKGK